MQENTWQKLELCLSPERLAVYGHDAPGHRIVVSRYLWNLAVSESLYAPLNMLEIGLRNAINRAMIETTGLDSWYDSVSLSNWGLKQINNAKTSITKSHKEIVPGQVVAELSFGFWTSMFENHYEQPDAKYLPKGIKATFPYMPKSLHNRKKIKNNLDKIRRLRNRIFHHERVIHWNDLQDQHELIFEFLGWLDPEIRKLAEIVDRFSMVYNEGTQPFLEKLHELPNDQ